MAEVSVGSIWCWMFLSAMITMSASLLSYCGTWLIWWVDDYDGVRPVSPLTRLIMNLLGHSLVWNTYNSEWRYYNRAGNPVDSGLRVMGFWAVMFLLPLLVVVSILHPALPISIGTFITVMFVARTARRYKKLLDKHVVDPDAHRK